MVDKNFGADEVLKINNDIKNKTNIQIEKDKVDLKPVKFYQAYELNDEGLRLYGMYKKQQHLNMIKWSVFGTCLGCVFAAIVDVSFKKMKFQSKDIVKTIILLGSIGLFTFHGIQISTMIFKTKQRELSQLYGKEIEDADDEEI
jgi:hypothetical protein